MTHFNSAGFSWPSTEYSFFFFSPVLDYFPCWLLINTQLFMFALAIDVLLISIALRRVFMPRTTVVWTAGWSTVSQISPGINKSWTTVSVLPLTGFPSPALPCDEDALVLVLVPQWTVGLICQSVAGRQKKTTKSLAFISQARALSLHNIRIFQDVFGGWFTR